MKTHLSSLVQRLFVSAILLASFVPFSQPQLNAASPDETSPIPLYVNTLLDSNDLVHQCSWDTSWGCSLRGAISIANADPGNVYQVFLPAGYYVLTIPGAGEDANATGDLDIHTNLLITGAGRDNTVIDARALDRVLQVHMSASLTIQGVTITGGWTADGTAGTDGAPGGDSERGGGIDNSGTLVLTDSAVTNNHTGMGGTGGSGPLAAGGSSGDGGGIYSRGWLTIDHTNVSDNRTGPGGTGGTEGESGVCSPTAGGRSGEGGGIYNANYLLARDSHISANFIGPGGEGGISSCYSIQGLGGTGGSGGGVYNTGTMQVETSELSLNKAGDGGGAAGAGGHGGGIYSTGWLEIKESQVMDNVAGNGARGDTHEGATGGSGGGIYTIGHLVITESILEGNQAGSGGAGGGWKGGGYRGGAAGGGGAIYNAGSLTLANTFIRSNSTGSGGDASEEHGMQMALGGPGGPGGGIYNDGETDLWNSPVTGNATGDGGGSESAYAGGTGGWGGGIYNTNSFSITYSPVLSNTTGSGGIGSTGGQGGSGGGIYNAGTLVSRFSPVKNNLTGQGGGGLSSSGKGGDGGGFYSTGSLDINGAEVYKNEAGLGGNPGLDGDGGGLYISKQGHLILTNAIIAENSIDSSGKGSGIYLGAPGELLHTTMARNAGGDGSGITVISTTINLTNTILVSHTVGISVAVNSTATLGNTLWGSDAWANGVDWSGSGAIFTGTQNLWAGPLFVNPDAINYHLSATSPAIDQGLSTWVDTDIDNQPRPNPYTNLPDLGADETWTLIPIDQVMINGPMTVTTRTPITYTALIIPSTATPNITYFWTPDPQAGQFTPIATYQWKESGMQDIRVMAMNTGGIVTDTLTIKIQRITLKLYLPIISRRP